MKLLLESWRQYLNESQAQTMDKLLKLGPVHGPATADALGMKKEFEKRVAEMMQSRKDMIYRLYEIEGTIVNIEKNLDTAWAPLKGTPEHTAYLDQVKELEAEHESLYPQLINVENLLEPWIGRDKRHTFPRPGWLMPETLNMNKGIK
jgi:hypothetical protein